MGHQCFINYYIIVIIIIIIIIQISNYCYSNITTYLHRNGF